MFVLAPWKIQKSVPDGHRIHVLFKPQTCTSVVSDCPVKSRREAVFVVLRRIIIVVRQVRIAFTFTASAFTLKTDRLCLVALDSSDPAKSYEEFKSGKILQTHLLNSTAGIC